MTTNRSIIKVFLASPGDLAEERRAAKRIVDEENANHAVEQGYQFELVGWEDTVAQHGRAQEIINRDLDQCNFFVGVVWKRWGTPPGPTGGVYSSGFEEEYERSEDRFRRSGKPSISLLFKTISDEDKRDVGPQLEKVLKFRKQFTDDYRGAYQTFADLRDFEQRFRAILAFFLRSQIKEDTNDQSEEKSRSIGTDTKRGTENAISDDTIFEKDAREFVIELSSRQSKETEFEYTPTEAARFRLLGKTLQLSQNDDETLGVHDANLIYRDLRNAVLSEREQRGLLSAGIANFGSRSIPLWHWLYNRKRLPRDELAFRTVIRGEVSQNNAFLILGLLGEDLRGRLYPLDREKLVGVWLSSKSNDTLVSAFGYFAECGSMEDVGKIEEHLNSSEASVSKAAVSAKVEILARSSIVQALEFIASREDVDISKKLLSVLLASPSTIETNLLKRCLLNRSTVFRKAIALELSNRNALGLEEAKLLTDSTDAETRVLGVRALRKMLPEFSQSDARTYIVKPKKNTSFLISDRDFEGEEALEAYIHEFLKEMSHDTLKTASNNESIYHHDALFAIYDKFFRNHHQEIIRNISDDFKGFISAKRENIDDPSLAPDEKLEDYLREKMLQKALELLCAKKSKADLTLVRQKIDNRQIRFSHSIVAFLDKYGDWEDVGRIIKLSEKFPYRGLSLLSIRDHSDDYALSARIMLNLGRERIGDLLASKMPSGLLNAVFREVGAKIFRSFDDTQIEEWLRVQTDSVRQTIALKAVLCLSKPRLSKILTNYIQGDRAYYYNAVFWLDLGVSADRASSARVAQKALSQG
jgi:hypothetical protein